MTKILTTIREGIILAVFVGLFTLIACLLLGPALDKEFSFADNMANYYR